MKLISRQHNRFIFEVSEPEKVLLLAILKLFPLSPLSHPRRQLSRNAAAPDAAANQQLLEDSLKIQQTDGRKWVASFCAEPGRFTPDGSGFRFATTRPEVEQLLQVLNDVRIGSWIALGSPESEQREEQLLNAQTAVHVHRLELAGLFQMFFLKAVSGAED